MAASVERPQRALAICAGALSPGARMIGSTSGRRPARKESRSVIAQSMKAISFTADVDMVVLLK
jgi:hypothetical protein